MSRFVIPEPAEPFEFENGGKGFSVPHLIDLPADEFNDVMDRLDACRGNNRASVMVAREVFESHAKGSTKGLTYAQLAALSDAWVMDGGKEAGEGDSSPE
ncbi:hypothetical protein [Bifidobacterium sp.]|uniref:hypothetical protein n=1 Tax=Bifidobacterium sp. TaxID=41200 RepID=UPI003865C01C